jgi:hypothetical protein
MWTDQDEVAMRTCKGRDSCTHIQVVSPKAPVLEQLWSSGSAKLLISGKEEFRLAPIIQYLDTQRA